jgi:PIN domain nuclease of toxin-antitoxin system
MRKWKRSWRAGIRFLLDTQAFVSAFQGTMPLSVQERLSNPDDERILSSISIVEIAIKNSIGKLDMSKDETNRAIGDLRITVLPFQSQHGTALFSIPLQHRDPFDRMILATAYVEKLPIVTADQIFRRYAGIKVIW